MARHVIPLDMDDAPEIVWDDEAGTVEGNNWFAVDLREQIAQEMPLNLSDSGRILYLKDPAHDPATSGTCFPIGAGRSRCAPGCRRSSGTWSLPSPRPHRPPRMIVEGVERELIPGVEFVW